MQEVNIINLKIVEKQKEISFDKIKEQLFNIIQHYYIDKSCNLLKLINELIILEKTIINKRGKNKNTIEEEILTWIRILYNDMIVDYEFDYECLEESIITNTKEKELKQVHSTSFDVYKLVQLILDFNMPNDNFCSKRKGHAISLLCSLLTEYHINGEFNIFKKVLETGKDELLIRALDELDSFIKQTEEELPDDIIQILDKLIKKTKNRSVAVGVA